MRKRSRTLRGILKRQAVELDHNLALEGGADFLESLDKWLNSATARRNNALKLLNTVRAGPMTVARPSPSSTRRSNQINRGQIASPSLAPEEGANDIAAENHSEPVNSQRSSGARTAAGKRKSSGNSRKHGLAALGRHQPAAADIEQLAKAICSGYQDAALLAQARRIAENELVLQAIRAHKLAVIERLRDPSAVPLAKGDNGTAMAQARLEEGKLAEKECEALIAKIFEKHKERLPPLAELNELLPHRRPHRRCPGSSSGAPWLDRGGPAERASRTSTELT